MIIQIDNKLVQLNNIGGLVDVFNLEGIPSIYYY